MASLPTTYSDPVPIAIIGGTGLGALPSPPFTQIAVIPPPQTPWGFPSSPISILSYQSQEAGAKTTTVAFLARHGLSHNIAPHEINNRANVAALKKLGVKCVIGFSAVGSLREEVKPRDLCVAGGVVDWTKGVRPWTFFEDGVVGHVGMAEPFDRSLSESVRAALSKPGMLEGDGLEVHDKSTIICIEGPQFSTRSESLLYRSFPIQPPISCIGMTSVPECKLFREAEMAYSLVCMATDYDSWHETNEGVSVEMVMGHMKANGANAKSAVAAILNHLAQERSAQVMSVERLRGSSRGGVMGLGQAQGKGAEAVGRLRWLFGDEWVDGGF